MANSDMEIGGYTIPKGALVISNIYDLHMNPKYWDTPQEFNPERWLGDNKTNINNEAYQPFGIGKRICIGEKLARLEIFIFTVALLQAFEFKMVDPSNPPSLQGHKGITRGPGHYSLIANRI